MTDIRNVKLQPDQIAQLLRSALASTFPGTPFEVVAYRFTNGADISIAWADGPSYSDVDRVADVFRGSDFGDDGIITAREPREVLHNGQPVLVTFEADDIELQHEFSEQLLQHWADSCRAELQSRGKWRGELHAYQRQILCSTFVAGPFPAIVRQLAEARGNAR